MQNNKAFSILELLVVIAIIAVISVFGYPKVDSWLADREVKTEVNRLIAYIEEKKSEVQSNKYPIIVIGFYQNMELWHMTQSEYSIQMKVPADGRTNRNNPSQYNNKSILNYYKMGPCCLDTIDYSNWVKETSGQFQWSGDTWHWMNSRMFLSKNAIIAPGTNHFTVRDNNSTNQDAFIMICSKTNTSNHYQGSSSNPCNNSGKEEHRYVLQMDRSLNVNSFKYNPSTDRWIKEQR